MKKKIIVWCMVFTMLLSWGWPDDVRAAEAAETAEVLEGSSETEQTENPASSQTADAVALTSEAAILMEAKTGTVIYDKNADTRMCPASITKIMTLLLIYEAMDEGKITLEDEVVTSAYAKSMGGSQVFLEEGEVQNVETLIKCIVVASGNDASVAMAEYIAGSEDAFVAMMNEKAAELGMTGTHFIDCCGLTDSDDHYTTARDVALMARALIDNYPQISDYATIWMENITHVTNKGSSEFGLSNTNKLLKMANNFEVTGLKTGSTSKAGYCFCATARKDDINLIAVIMDAPDYKIRFAEAQQLLNYGYANCRYYEDKNPPVLSALPVKKGVEDSVMLDYGGTFSYVSFQGEDLSGITSEVILEEELTAPFEAGTKAGYIAYSLNGKNIGQIDIVTADGMQEAGFKDYLKKIYDNLISLCG